QLLMGLFHFGFLTVYLSDPLTRGLTTGAGVHVFTSQIKHVFGISTGKFTGPLKLVFLYKTFFEKIVDTNMAPLITSLICILIIYSLQKWVSPKMRKAIKIPLPAELIVLIFGTLISHYCKFSSPQVFNMKVVGKIPQGIPFPKPPNLLLIPQVALDAFAIAVVSFTINISMAKMFSSKHGYNLDSNQELIAYGISNIVCCNLNSYVSTASLSRSLVQESTGGKTQVAGLVSSSLLLVVLLFIGPLFHDLPNCILAAVIIVNLRGIFLQVCDLKYLSRISRADMFTWLVTCLGVVLTDVDFGLLVGLAFSFLTIVLRNQITKLQSLGNIPGTELYEDVLDYHEAKEINGIRIFRFKNSLFFANAEYFQTSM
ncbi:hypothetical protein HELRODRAFT_119893, partial [Helobdella robusta]|uniref:STAS domain-containing protein n=1 Tax=Helobdella robusta TaxID=6412 RepID=T1EGN9_HELRO